MLCDWDNPSTDRQGVFYWLRSLLGDANKFHEDYEPTLGEHPNLPGPPWRDIPISQLP